MSQLSYILSSCKDLMTHYKEGLSEKELETSVLYEFDASNMWSYGYFFIVLISLMTFVRNIAKFSFIFAFANFLIVMTMVIVCFYSLKNIGEAGVKYDELQPINISGFASTTGFVIYLYEGIGVLMPIMQATEDPKAFPKVFTNAILGLTGLYIVYGLLVYSAFGEIKK